MDRNNFPFSDSSHLKLLDSNSLFSFMSGETPVPAKPEPVRIHRGPIRIDVELRRAADQLGLALPLTSTNSSPDSPVREMERDLHAVMQILVQRLRESTGAMDAVLASGLERALVPLSTAGVLAVTFAAALELIAPLIAESVRERQVILFNDVRNEANIDLMACGDARIASVALMPLFSGEQLEGIIALFAATPHAFAEKDLQTIERIAASLQTAIHEGELAGVHLATGSAEAPR